MVSDGHGQQSQESIYHMSLPLDPPHVFPPFPNTKILSMLQNTSFCFPQYNSSEKAKPSWEAGFEVISIAYNKRELHIQHDPKFWKKSFAEQAALLCSPCVL